MIETGWYYDVVRGAFVCNVVEDEVKELEEKHCIRRKDVGGLLI